MDGAWASRTAFPALTGATMPKLADTIDIAAATPDLSRTVLSTQFPLDANDQGIVNARTFVWTEDAYLRGDTAPAGAGQADDEGHLDGTH